MVEKVKVLVVDDSELIRNILTEIINDDDLEVVGVAIDPYDARDKIKKLSPDVITLDIEMPRMDGITFLSNLMRLRPMPVVMISTLTEKGADVTIQALELGAVDFIPKPVSNVMHNINLIRSEIIFKIKSAACANLSALAINNGHEKNVAVKKPKRTLQHKVELIAIGASTGGSEAIKEVLCGLPDEMPPIVVVQHMPGGFTRSYAQRLDKLLALTVEEFTADRAPLKANHVYVANGDQHLKIEALNGTFYGVCDDSEPVNRHRPAVDVLFESVAVHCPTKAIGVILTGMGSDGAAGLGAIKESKGLTIAQDEMSSVVWGMPRVAVERNAALHVLPLNKISNMLVDCCYKA